MSKIFGYARLSTLDQNLDTQLDALRSGLREGDTVIVARYFRLGRSRDHVIHLVNEFAQKGVNFKALDVGIDTHTPAGKPILSIFASLAEYNWEMILEKTRADQLLAKAKGKYIGRPKGGNLDNYQRVKRTLEK